MSRAVPRMVARALGRVGLAVFLAACSEHSVTAPAPDPLSNRLVVSAPIDGPNTLSASVANAALSAPRHDNGSAEVGLVYVSLLPGSIATADDATVRDVVTGQSVTVPLVNGGFDPVALAANIGDEIMVEVRSRTGAVLVSAPIKVPPRRPPTIVRSAPPNGATDVPLNSVIKVVFSEPVDETTIAASLQLFQGVGSAAGTATLDSSGLIVTFAPASPLATDTDYTLLIASSLRNLAGDPLEQSARIGFTTGDRLAGLPPSQNIAECPATSAISSTALERVGDMAESRKGAATLLPDGRVLIFGGTLNSAVRPQTEVYDPATRRFAAADQMMTSRGGHPAVMLPAGKLLFLDGILLQDGRVFFATPVSSYLQLQNTPFSPPSYAEIYDPTSDSFTRVGAFAHPPIWWDTATLLSDGRVLLTGNEGGSESFSNVSQLFDPRTNTFRNTGVMQGWYDTSGWGTLLADGKVLFVEWCFELCDDQVELYDPSTETFTVVGSIYGDLPYSRAVRLADGRVLITGGQVPGGKGTNETLIYEPASRALVLGPMMNCGRREHSATLLPDGTVLIAGGYSAPSTDLTPTAEIFHPGTP